MKKILGFALAIALMLTMCAPAFAAGKLNVVNEKMVVMESYSGYTAYIYAVLENTGDKPVEFSSGLIEIFDENGDVIDSDDYISCYPGIVEPGETAFIFDYVDAKDATSADYIDDYSLTVSSKSAKENTCVMLDCSATLSMEPYSYTFSTLYPTITAIVTNNTEETVRNIYAVVAVFDADGTIMYADSFYPYNTGLLPGSSLELRSTVNSKTFEKWEADGTSPGSIAVIAYSDQG